MVIWSISKKTNIVNNAINNVSGINNNEKNVAKRYPVSAINISIAKKITDIFIVMKFKTPYAEGTQQYKDQNQVNAFRHAMWNALSTQYVGSAKIKIFTDAHEEFNDINKKDLFNNQAGRSVGEENMFANPYTVADLIIEKIKQGNLHVEIMDYDPFQKGIK